MTEMTMMMIAVMTAAECLTRVYCRIDDIITER